MGDTRAVRAFIGSFTSAGGRGVVAASVDPGTGALTATAATRAVADPSYLAAADSVLYAVSETADGAVAAFDIAGGTLRPIGGPVSVGGHSPTHLAVTRSRLLTAHYGSGSVSVLPLGPGGAPGPVASVVRYEGRGPDRDRQTRPHAHQIQPDPSGRWPSTSAPTRCASMPSIPRRAVRRRATGRPPCRPAPDRAISPSTPAVATPTCWASWSRR